MQPNHHAHHKGFSGIGGYVAGLTFLLGRRDDTRLVCDLLGLGEADRAVDVGCGSGVTVREAVRRGTRVVGVDPSPEMLRLAARFVRSERAEWCEGTAEALPIEDGWATAVWSVGTVHHWQDVPRGLAEVHRTLGDGGRFLALERTAVPGAKGLASHGWTPEQSERFVEMCHGAGLPAVMEEHDSHRGRLLVVRATRA